MDAKNTYTITTTDAGNAINLIYILESMVNGKFSIYGHYLALMNVLELLESAVCNKDEAREGILSLENYQAWSIINIVSSINSEFQSLSTELSKQQS